MFPSSRWPSWALGYMWAPEIHYVIEFHLCYNICTYKLIIQCTFPVCSQSFQGQFSQSLGYRLIIIICQVNNQYHVYFSAKSSTNQKFCLGVARSYTSHHMIRIDFFLEHQVLLDLLRTLVTHSWRTSTLGSLTSIGSVIQRE